MIAPAVLAAYHLSADERARELTGSVAADQRFPIASVTKTLTALLAARLCVDGVISWDRPLSTPAADVSLRALLGHTAGIPFELHPEHWGPGSLTDAEVSSAAGHPPRLPLPPGSWHYSNLGYALVAHVLQEATGVDFARLLTERLLDPLGMTSTSFPDEKTEAPLVLGAAAPAGDLWSTLDDLMVLASALDGRRPEVVTRPMVALLLSNAVPDQSGGLLGAGLRTHQVRHQRVIVSSGTIRDRTTCLAVWPGRGGSVFVADAGHSHDALWRIAAVRWHRDDTTVRSWWWDSQEVVELRHRDEVELSIRETTWPFALFSGRVADHRLIGHDWRGQPLELHDLGDALVGSGIRLTADLLDSAYLAET